MRFPIQRPVMRALTVIIAFLVFVPSAQAIDVGRPASDDPVPVAEETVWAIHNGSLIDLSEGWNGAQACVVIPDELRFAECFDTAAERDDRIADLGLTERFADGAGVEGASFAAASCSSYLKLYDGYSYSGASLWLATRNIWLNMSSYGFNQKASSYKVGGCSTYMADYSNGGGAWIPTSATQAWDVDAVISGSWNNDISSVYIR